MSHPFLIIALKPFSALAGPFSTCSHTSTCPKGIRRHDFCSQVDQHPRRHPATPADLSPNKKPRRSSDPRGFFLRAWRPYLWQICGGRKGGGPCRSNACCLPLSEPPPLADVGERLILADFCRLSRRCYGSITAAAHQAVSQVSENDLFRTPDLSPVRKSALRSACTVL